MYIYVGWRCLWLNLLRHFAPKFIVQIDLVILKTYKNVFLTHVGTNKLNLPLEFTWESHMSNILFENNAFI